MVKRRRRKSVRAKEHRVYCTYFPDNRYYIGYSCKPEKQWEKYFGSSKYVKESTEELRKELIVSYPERNKAKLQEMLFQLQYREDPRCLNDMIHIRLRLKFIKDFIPVDWEPKDYDSLLL